MKLFVYGSLKRGKHNNDILGDSKFLGQAVIKNGFTLYVDYLPYLVKDRSGAGVSGELFEIDNETLRLVDYLEGHPLMYRRTKVWVTDATSGEDIEAYVYLYCGIIPDHLEPRREYV